MVTAKEDLPPFPAMEMERAGTAGTDKFTDGDDDTDSPSGAGFIKIEAYKLMATVGVGSFGRVRLARHRNQDTLHAIKIMKKSDLIRLQQVQHTLDEKACLDELKHPFIIRLQDSFQDLWNLYMVFEFVQGGELFSLLRNRGTIEDSWAKFYAAEVVMAFSYMHSKQVVYRDLKPENMMIDANGHLRLVDFGFAKRVLLGKYTYTLCGTPEYMAPEVLMHKGYQYSVDWWALGILIFESLVGFPPFCDEDPMSVYQLILAGEFHFPKKPIMMPEAKNICKRLIVADLTKRLGCGRNRGEEVKDHKWFEDINWQKCEEQKLIPPYIPPLDNDVDLQNFDSYPENESEPEAPDMSNGDPFENF